MTVDARSCYPWLAVAGLALAVTVAALTGQGGSHGAPAPPRPASASTGYYPPTGFGGYYWKGAHIGQISATWVVPTPSTDQPFATASTWIGLQDEGDGPFMQVGATETAYDADLPSSGTAPRAPSSGATRSASSTRRSSPTSRAATRWRRA